MNELLPALREANPGLVIFETTSPHFAQYGRIVEHPGLAAVVDYLAQNVPIGHKGVEVVPSDQGAEALDVFPALEQALMGGLPAQLGWCSGKGGALTALEYHMGSGILLAATDLVLLLGDVRALHASTLYSDNLRAFFVPARQSVELYGTTLYHTPCAARKSGFKAGVMLPRGTGEPLEEASECPTLRAKNKWMVAHVDEDELISLGVPGLIFGRALSLRPVDS